MVIVSGTDTYFLVAAGPRSGTPTWVTSLIAAGAAILAATATAVATAYAARRKVAEIELQHSLTSAKEYLETARGYTQSVYLPLAVAVSSLHEEYLLYQTGSAYNEDQEFVEHCHEFISQIRDLFGRGASAVLTLKLDEVLTHFIAFLEDSTEATEVRKENDIALSASLGALWMHTSIERQGTVPLTFWPYDSFSVWLPGIRFRLKQRPVLVAAPIGSTEFKQQFTIYVNTIKAAIKEVTLGAYGNRDAGSRQ